MEMEKKKKNSVSNGEEDYWQDILSRLPVESICRFKSVCKSWNSLTSSPFFIDLHRSITRPQQHICNLRSDLHFPFWFHLPEAIPDEENYLSINVVDVVCGLVCISYSLDSTFDSTIIWNPAIHRYINLPRLPFPSHINSLVDNWRFDFPGQESIDHIEETARFYSNAIGFGYDRITDDFKVVRIWLSSPYVEMRTGYIQTTYEIYSLKHKQWKTVIAESVKLNLMIDALKLRNGCFFDGKINWIVKTQNLQFARMLIFDCETEELTTMDLPAEVYEPKPDWENPFMVPVVKEEVLEYGGLLSIIVQRQLEQTTELWSLNNTNEWIRIFKLERHCDLLKMYEPSVAKLAPNAPREWIMFDDYVDPFRQVFSYRETMILLDHPQAKTYSRNQILDIDIPYFPLP